MTIHVFGIINECPSYGELLVPFNVAGILYICVLASVIRAYRDQARPSDRSRSVTSVKLPTLRLLIGLLALPPLLVLVLPVVLFPPLLLLLGVYFWPTYLVMFIFLLNSGFWKWPGRLRQKLAEKAPGNSSSSPEEPQASEPQLSEDTRTPPSDIQ